MFNHLTPVLIRATSIFVILLAISIIVVFVSYAYMESAYQDEKTAKRDLYLWQGKINSSVANNQIIDEFESNFLKLVEQGVVGSEDRLSWFETIQKTAEQRGMPSVKYSISAQERLNQANLKSQYRGIDVFKSVMRLDIEMAHEGDLFALLNDLKMAGGLFAVDSCNIEKINKDFFTGDTNKEISKLKAYCELGWYTFKNSNANAAGNSPG